jgi:outer membrane protein
MNSFIHHPQHDMEILPMKKIFLSMVAIATFTLYAATPAFAADMHVGVINMQELLQQLPQMKKIGEDLKKQFSGKQVQLVAAQDNFKRNAEKFKRDTAVMPAKDKQAAEDKLFKEQQDLQAMQMDLQRDYMAAQNKEVDALMTKIKNVVEKIATRSNLDLVLVNASVAYAKKDMDITKQVLKEID